MDSHQPCEFYENQLKTATCIVTVIIIISWKSRIFWCKLKNIHDVLLLKSILIRKTILWINFVLIEFSISALLFEKSSCECKNPIRPCVLSRTTVQWKCGVAFSHSMLYTLRDFGPAHHLMCCISHLLHCRSLCRHHLRCIHPPHLSLIPTEIILCPHTKVEF